MEKREAALFRAAAQQCSAAPEECTLFDDSPVACRGAKEAGLHVVGVFDSILRKTKMRCAVCAIPTFTTFQNFYPQSNRLSPEPENKPKFDPAGHIIGQPGFLLIP